MSASELTVERLLRAHAPHAPERLRERVLTLEPAPQRRNMPSRRLLLVALPAALAIAVGAAVVHGFVGSGSRPVASVTVEQSLSAPAQGRTDLRKQPFQPSVRDSSLPEAQKVILQIRLAESKRALAQRLNARKGTISAGTTAQISLVIGTEKAIAPVVHHRGRLGRMLHSAVGFLALEGMILLYALIVISPLAIVAAAIWAWRRRSVERLLAA